MSIGEFWAGRMSARELLALIVRLPAENGAMSRGMEKQKALLAAERDDIKAQQLAEAHRRRAQDGGGHG